MKEYLKEFTDIDYKIFSNTKPLQSSNLGPYIYYYNYNYTNFVMIVGNDDYGDAVSIGVFDNIDKPNLVAYILLQSDDSKLLIDKGNQFIEENISNIKNKDLKSVLSYLDSLGLNKILEI